MSQSLAEQMNQVRSKVVEKELSMVDPENPVVLETDLEMADPESRDFYAKHVGKYMYFEAIVAMFTYQPDGFNNVQMLLKNITYNGAQVADHTWVSVPAVVKNKNMAPQGCRIRLKAKPYEYKPGKYGLWFLFVEILEEKATHLQGLSLINPQKAKRSGMASISTEYPIQTESTPGEQTLALAQRSLHFYHAVMMEPLANMGIEGVPDELEMPVRRMLVGATRGVKQDLFLMRTSDAALVERLKAFMPPTAELKVSRAVESMGTEIEHLTVTINLGGT